MSFQVDSQTVEGGIEVLTVRGELDLGTADEFKAPLDTALEKDRPSILIDLTECEFIDSTGVALIVEAWQRLSEGGGGRLALCCPNSQVRRVLEITGIQDSISLHTDRDEALGALRNS